MSMLGDGKCWIGRNCDWLTPTLTRGVSAVVHEIPNRIPIMAVGIRGDIDLDTGLNAEGLWIHLHTLHATDPMPTGMPYISWLFWAREALETCASLDDLERFIETTARDRGVMVIASEGGSGRRGGVRVFAGFVYASRRRRPIAAVCHESLSSAEIQAGRFGVTERQRDAFASQDASAPS